MLSIETLRPILKRHCGGNVEELFDSQCTYQRIFRFVQSMRLDEIKKILREIKLFPNYGHISLDRNKPLQVETLSLLVHSVIQSNSGVSKSASTEVKSQGFAGTESMKADLPNSTTYPLKSSSSFIPHSDKQRVQHVDNREIILNSSKKKDIFYQLSVVSGVTKQDILRELAECPHDQLSKDNILLRILSRKDPDGKAFVDIETVLDIRLKQQEDAAMDQAILESEKERDHIQIRKKRRVEELKNNIQVELSNQAEFKNSILLFGLDGDCSSSTPRCMGGSTLIRLICMIFKHYASDLDPVELVCLNSSKMRDLRILVADLLLLEADTIKYYKDAAYPFLLWLIDELDSSKVLPLISDLNGSGVNLFSVTTITVIHTLDNFFRENLDFFCEFLLAIVSNFQKGLCKIPKDGSLIPDFLRRKKLIPYIALLRNQVDKDGFEVVDSYSAIKIVSESEDDVDDDNDYDNDSD